MKSSKIIWASIIASILAVLLISTQSWDFQMPEEALVPSSAASISPTSSLDLPANQA